MEKFLDSYKTNVKKRPWTFVKKLHMEFILWMHLTKQDRVIFDIADFERALRPLGEIRKDGKFKPSGDK